MSNEEQRHRDNFFEEAALMMKLPKRHATPWKGGRLAPMTPGQAGNKTGSLSTNPVYEPTRTTRQQPVIYHCECLKRILESSSESPPLEGTSQRVQ
jgi:hypothetical protein